VEGGSLADVEKNRFTIACNSVPLAVSFKVLPSINEFYM
jgi:hypothetical protein